MNIYIYMYRHTSEAASVTQVRNTVRTASATHYQPSDGFRQRSFPSPPWPSGDFSSSAAIPAPALQPPPASAVVLHPTRGRGRGSGAPAYYAQLWRGGGRAGRQWCPGGAAPRGEVGAGGVGKPSRKRPTTKIKTGTRASTRERTRGMCKEEKIRKR